jgi:hypothetical protein
MKTYFLYVMVILSFSCSKEFTQEQNIEICKIFYEANKHKDMDIFYATEIRAIRTHEDKSGEKYAWINKFLLHDLTTDSSDYIFASRYTSSWDYFLKNDSAVYLSIYQKRFGTAPTSTKLKCLEYSINLVNRYYDLKLPTYKINGIYAVVSRPSNGNFVAFHLTKFHHLYYVPALDRLKKTEWKNYFMKLQRFDEKWYYCVGENCKW